MKVSAKKEQMREEIPSAGTVSSGAEGTSPNTLAGIQKASILSGRFRWVICGLLFLGVTKNYMDRQVLGVLKGPLQHQFGWNDVYYGHLVTAFQTAYALGMICVGRLIEGQHEVAEEGVSALESVGREEVRWLRCRFQGFFSSARGFRAGKPIDARSR